jgi:hypothetical protein
VTLRRPYLVNSDDLDKQENKEWKQD